MMENGNYFYFYQCNNLNIVLKFPIQIFRSLDVKKPFANTPTDRQTFIKIYIRF
jgi:hypothetical protein